MGNYFLIGMFSTLSFNAVLSRMADNLLAGFQYRWWGDQFAGGGVGETTMGEEGIAPHFWGIKCFLKYEEFVLPDKRVN